jgi:hypothetical protein
MVTHACERSVTLRFSTAAAQACPLSENLTSGFVLPAASILATALGYDLVGSKVVAVAQLHRLCSDWHTLFNSFPTTTLRSAVAE